MGWGEGHLNPKTDGYIPCLSMSSCACALQCDEYMFGRPRWCLDETRNGSLQADGSVNSTVLFNGLLVSVEMREGKQVRTPKEDGGHESAPPSDCPMMCSGRGSCERGKNGSPNYCM